MKTKNARPTQLTLLLAVCHVMLTGLGAHPASGQPYDLGERKAIFDDFAYTAKSGLNEAMSQGRKNCSDTGGIFECNRWQTGPHSKALDRFWRRSNWDDNSLGRGTRVYVEKRSRSSDRVVLERQAGYGADENNDPRIAGGVLLPHHGHGTYAARIWFDKAPPQNRKHGGYNFNQAFWLWSRRDNFVYVEDGQHKKYAKEQDCAIDFDEYRAENRQCTRQWGTEIDFEFNNHFSGGPGQKRTDSRPRMKINFHEWPLRSTGRFLDCTLRTAEGFRSFPECVSDERGSLIEKNWFTLVLQVDTVRGRVGFSMWADGWNGRADSDLWAGAGTGATRYGQLKYIHGNLGLNEHLIPKMSFNIDTDDDLETPKKQKADWFYYTPELIRRRDVQRHVQHLRDQNLSRVNTTGLTFDWTEATGFPYRVAIRGPRRKRAATDASYSYRIFKEYPHEVGDGSPNTSGATGNYNVIFAYRTRHASGTTSDWHYSDTPNLTVPVADFACDDSVEAYEVKLKVANAWSGQHRIEKEHLTVSVPEPSPLNCEP